MPQPRAAARECPAAWRGETWLFVGLPGRPRPSPFGPWWLDPGPVQLVGSGTLASSGGSHGTWTTEMPVLWGHPAECVPPWGEQLAFQALVDDGTEIRLAHPVVALLSARGHPWRYP